MRKCSKFCEIEPCKICEIDAKFAKAILMRNFAKLDLAKYAKLMRNSRNKFQFRINFAFGESGILLSLETLDPRIIRHRTLTCRECRLHNKEHEPSEKRIRV